MDMINYIKSLWAGFSEDIKKILEERAKEYVRSKNGLGKRVVKPTYVKRKTPAGPKSARRRANFEDFKKAVESTHSYNKDPRDQKYWNSYARKAAAESVTQ